MSTRANRQQSQQIFRVGIIVGIVGIVVVVGGFVIYFLLDQGSRQVPLEIPPYPGAENRGHSDTGTWSRSEFFRIPNANADDVAAYYNQKMTELYGNSDEQCVRIPNEGNFATYSENTPDIAPYQYTCNFDRSYWGASQYTMVFIQPGVFNEDPTLNTQGMTVVRYDQQWNP